MARSRQQGPRADAQRRLVADYEQSGLTRGEYCRLHNIPVTTLDYYRRQAQRHGIRPRLLPVETGRAEASQASGFALVLNNGRRIESDWSFEEAGLARLMRLAERV